MDDDVVRRLQRTKDEDVVPSHPPKVDANVPDRPRTGVDNDDPMIHDGAPIPRPKVARGDTPFHQQMVDRDDVPCLRRGRRGYDVDAPCQSVFRVRKFNYSVSVCSGC